MNNVDKRDTNVAAVHSGGGAAVKILIIWLNAPILRRHASR